MIWNIGGYDVLIDDEDYERLKGFKYSTNASSIKRGYCYFRRNIWIDGRRTGAWLHRDIMQCVKGDGVFVYHKYGNTLDNRKVNLRLGTQKDNNHNYKKPITNTSGVKGVSLKKATGKWYAYIRVDGKRKSLGYFTNIKDAEAAYAKASKEFHGEFGRLA